MNKEGTPCPKCIEIGTYVLMLLEYDGKQWIYICDECKTKYDKNLGILED